MDLTHVTPSSSARGSKALYLSEERQKKSRGTDSLSTSYESCSVGLQRFLGYENIKSCYCCSSDV